MNLAVHFIKARSALILSIILRQGSQNVGISNGSRYGDNILFGTFEENICESLKSINVFESIWAGITMQFQKIQ